MSLVEDLAALARFGPTLDGKAIDPEATLVRGGGKRARSGRSEWVDERHDGLAQALRARARLAALRRTEGGPLAAAVLELAYVRLGAAPGQRPVEELHRLIGAWHRWCWARGQQAPLVDRVDPDDLLFRLRRGLQLQRAQLQRRGLALLDAATGAYEEQARSLAAHF